MRAYLPGLRTPYPLGSQLPAIYADDDMVQRLTTAFDDVLAPALSTLDNLAAYFDPDLAPADFLIWLAGWVAANVDADWPAQRQRDAVARAVSLHGCRGTLRGLAEQVELTFGLAPEIEDSGGTRWSAKPRSRLPGQPRPHLTVRLRVTDPASVDVRALDALVAANRPAHVPYAVEVIQAERTRGPSPQREPVDGHL